MKQIKNKYVRLTESELKSIVKEAVNKQLRLIMEYDIPRSKFIENADGYLGNVFEHMFLVKYSVLNGGLREESHWRKEVFKFMTNISKKGIKGMDVYDTRKKALSTAFDYNNLFNGYDGVKRLIEAKIMSESIDIDSDEAINCIKYCSDNVEIVLDLLAKGDAKDIWQFVQSI